MIWLEEKYIAILSGRLSLFKKVRQNAYVFRCPLCGDSKKNLFKTRGGLYVPPGSDSYNMGCFNCGASMKFTRFLELQDKSLYDEYRMESYREKFGGVHVPAIKTEIQPKPKYKKFDLASLTRIDRLSQSHPALGYIQNRMIPEKQYHRLFYAPKYVQWISEYQGKRYDPNIEHPRLIIPFFDRFGNTSRIAARAFGNENNKYLYTVADRDSTRLYGIDQVDQEHPVYVLEGPLDSLFIPNSIAVGGASYTASELASIPDKIFVPDNEPRNRQVCDSIEKVVKSGQKICLWQRETEKDINQMIMSGMSIQSVLSLISESTFSGIEAELKFKEWIRY